MSWVKKLSIMGVLLSLFIVSACSSAGTNNGDGKAAKDGNVETSEQSGEAKFSGTVHVFATNWIIKEDDRIKEYSAKVKEKFGFDLKFTAPPFADSEEKLNVMLASGEDIDVIWKSTPGGMLSLVEKGYLQPLTTYVNNSEVLNEENWLGVPYLETLSAEGEIYGIPNMKPSGYIPTINKAWLDKLNLPIPTTFEELNTTLQAFKDAKLAGDATIPLAHQWSYGDHIASFLGMWGLEGPNPVMDANGSITHPWLTPEAKEGFIWLQDMYKNKILDTEFPTAQEEPLRQKVINGMVGVFFDWPGANYDMNKKGKEAGKLVEMVAMDQLAAKAGITPVTPGNTITSWMIPKTSKNPDAAFKLIEFWNTPEGADLFGMMEGYDYNMVDGKKTVDPQKANFFVSQGESGTLVKDWTNTAPDTEEAKLGSAVLNKFMKFPPAIKGQAQAQDITRSLALKTIMGESTVDEFQAELKKQLLNKKLITE